MNNITNPFLNTSNNNNFLSNLNSTNLNPFNNTSSNLNNNPFNTKSSISNNSQNLHSPFNTLIQNSNNNNTNSLFSTIKTSILNNNTNNNSLNPFLSTNNNNSINTTTSTLFNNNTSTNNFFNNNLYNNQNNVYMENNIIFPICQSFNKMPPPSFPIANFKIIKDFEEKNTSLNKIKYYISRIENIVLDENFKNFSVEEIRAADYINNKIEYFNDWKENQNNISNNINFTFEQKNNMGINNSINPFNQNINGTYNIFNNNINSNSQNNNLISNSTNNNPFFKNNLNNNNSSNFFNNVFKNNNSNDGNIFNNKNTINNPFLTTNNQGNNNNLNFLNNNSNTNNTNIFNNQTNNNNNIFLNNANNNNSSNIFNINNNNTNFLNNNNNNTNIFNIGSNNTNNDNNIFNTNNNNIFNNNTITNSNILNNNISNNNNIFNNYQNQFNNILTNNNNNNTSNTNNNLINSIFNNNQNNFYEKPFSEKIKDKTWLKRNVNIIDESNLFMEHIPEVERCINKMQEMQYFSEKENENDVCKNKEKELTFTKIVFPSDEELEKAKNKKNIEKEEKAKINIIKEEKEEDEENNLKKNRYVWNPLPICLNNEIDQDREVYFGKIINKRNEYRNIKINSNNNKNNGISGFKEAYNILDHLDNQYIDFSCFNNEPKEYILATERPDFGSYKFNNEINNNKSYLNFNRDEGENYLISNDEKNNNNIHTIHNKNYNGNINLINNNEVEINLENNNNIEIINTDAPNNYISNKAIPLSFKKNNIINENNIEENITNKKYNDFNIISNSKSFSSTNMTRRKQIINNGTNISEMECKIIYTGECSIIPELKSPIIIKLSSLIKNSSILNNNVGEQIDIEYENILIIDLTLLFKEIRNFISSINDIDDKILLPSDEDIFFQINGKIYSKLTNMTLKLKDLEKRIEDNNNLYYYIHYNFKLKQYPILLNNEDKDIIYQTKPTLSELLDKNNNYDLKKVENFEVWNKFGKIIFIDPIDLSGKVIINEIIKITDGEVDLDDPRVDKLKAKVFLKFDLGEKLEGTFLENIKTFLRYRNSTFVKYDKNILEYNVNC